MSAAVLRRAATAELALRRPPLTADVVSESFGSTPASSSSLSAAADEAGLAARIDARAAATCGAAMDVPEE